MPDGAPLAPLACLMEQIQVHTSNGQHLVVTQSTRALSSDIGLQHKLWLGSAPQAVAYASRHHHQQSFFASSALIMHSAHLALCHYSTRHQQ